MSGIYIRGMEMPKDGCHHMICIYADGTVSTGGRAYKAIPVPQHGRLIDVDYADDYAYDELELANSYLTGWEAARAMQKIYQNAPTIIPADPEEEEMK